MWLTLTGVAWLLDLRIAERNPPFEFAILSLRYAGFLPALALALGHRLRAVGPMLSLGFLLWTAFLGVLAVGAELFSLVRFR